MIYRSAIYGGKSGRGRLGQLPCQQSAFAGPTAERAGNADTQCRPTGEEDGSRVWSAPTCRRFAVRVVGASGQPTTKRQAGRSVATHTTASRLVRLDLQFGDNADAGWGHPAYNSGNDGKWGASCAATERRGYSSEAVIKFLLTRWYAQRILQNDENGCIVHRIAGRLPQSRPRGICLENDGARAVRPTMWLLQLPGGGATGGLM